MRLSVIIVNQNACVRLKQALKTILLSCEGITNEIFVVDNASIDGSVGMVQQEFPEVQIILNEKPTSITKATNQALVLANGQYTLLINPDTITKKDTLSKTLAFMDKRPEAGGLTVRMVDPMGNFLSQSKRGLSTQWVAFFKLTGLSKMLSKSRLYDRMHEYWFEDFETSEIDILSSAFMLLRSSVLQRTGFLDERFAKYGQNIDLSYRIRIAGFRNYYFPKTFIINFQSQNQSKFSWDYIKNYYGAMLIFAGKYLFKLPRLKFRFKGMGPIFPPSYEIES